MILLAAAPWRRCKARQALQANNCSRTRKYLRSVQRMRHAAVTDSAGNRKEAVVVVDMSRLVQTIQVSQFHCQFGSGFSAVDSK